MTDVSGHQRQVRVPAARAPLHAALGRGPGLLQEGRQVRVADPGHPRREDRPQHHPARHPALRKLPPRLPRGNLGLGILITCAASILLISVRYCISVL